MDDLTLDIAALEREPLFRAKAGAGNEENERPVGAEFLGKRLQLLPGLEGANLLALRERVGNKLGRILVEDLPGNGRI
jgi:hypothetical protein